MGRRPSRQHRDATPEQPLTDDWWECVELGIDELRVHPFNLLDDEDWALLELFQARRGRRRGSAAVQRRLCRAAGGRHDGAAPHDRVRGQAGKAAVRRV